jgi:PKD domain
MPPAAVRALILLLLLLCVTLSALSGKAQNVVAAGPRIGTGAAIVSGIPSPNQQPAGPVQPSQQPSGPSQPAQPSQLPSNPAQPSQLPTNPAQPTQPINNPSQPVQPTQPIYNPAQPSQPIYNPAQPTQPIYNPVQPEQPIYNPVYPEQPIYNPVYPEQPIYNPVYPEQPIYYPVQPEQPIYIPPGEPQVQIAASVSSAVVGQAVSFIYSVTAGSAPIQQVLISFDDGVILTGNASGGTISHTYTSPGNYEPLITASDSNGLSAQDATYLYVTAPTGSQPPPTTVIVANGGPGVLITAATPTAPVGQPISVSYTTTPGLVPVQSVLIAWGDGLVTAGPLPAGTVSHTYYAPGTFQITVTATDTSGLANQAVATTSIAAQAVPAISITYPVGWNLVAAPTGTVMTGATPPLYTWQSGDVAYVSSDTTTTGYGHWAYFPAPSTVSIPVTSPTVITKALQPNQYVMIGNSGTTSATVTGADVIYIYNPTSGYQTTNVLQPGQGAWALSYTGGNVTITSNPG